MKKPTGILRERSCDGLVANLPRLQPDTSGSVTMYRRNLARRSLLGAALLPALPWRIASAQAQTAVPANPEGPVRILFDVQANPPLIRGVGTAIDAEKPGLTIEMLRMASETAHIPIELSRVPWERGLYLIETGQADAIFASSYVEARTRFAVYPMKDGNADPRRKLFDQSYRLYVRAGSGVAELSTSTRPALRRCHGKRIRTHPSRPSADGFGLLVRSA